MFENDLGSRPEKHPVINLIIILLMVGLGFVIVGPIIGFFFALPFYEGSMIDLAEAIQQPLDGVYLVLHGAMYGPQAAFITELFPTRFRYSGASLAYQVTGSGTTSR